MLRTTRSLMIGEEDAPEEEEAEEEQPEAQGTSEPGWMKRRIEKAVSKAVAQTEQRLKEQYEQQFAPLMAKMLEQEAKELVRQGEFKSLDRAKEYLQLKQGIQPQPKAQPPRNEQGQFQSRNDAAIETRAQVMAEQAVKVQESRGVDVLSEYYDNDETRQKIISGEWDFYDVADMLEKRKSSRPKAPSPMRSPNGASGSEKSSIASMSDEQFRRLEARISEGARYKI